MAEKQLNRKMYYLDECKNVYFNHFHLVYHKKHLFVSNGVSSLLFEIAFNSHPKHHIFFLKLGKLYNTEHYKELLKCVKNHVVEVFTKRAKIVKHQPLLYVIDTDTIPFHDDQYTFRGFP
jgi:hypothetical protein